MGWTLLHMRSLCVIYCIYICIGSALGEIKCPSPVGFFPHEKQCDKYYECIDGKATENLCPDGLVFNTKSAPAYLRCDSPIDVDCSTRPELQKPYNSSNCPRRFGMYADKDDCQVFWNCIDGVATRSTCPEGLVFNPAAGACDWPGSVQKCNAEKFLGFKCPENSAVKWGDHSYYPHRNDCRKHYACIMDESGTVTPRLLTCHFGLVYHIEGQRCEFPEKVPGCENYYPKPSINRPVRVSASTRPTGTTINRSGRVSASTRRAATNVKRSGRVSASTRRTAAKLNRPVRVSTSTRPPPPPTTTTSTAATTTTAITTTTTAATTTTTTATITTTTAATTTTMTTQPPPPPTRRGRRRRKKQRTTTSLPLETAYFESSRS